MAVLNLTIDSAPTKPRDNAREDLTMEITKVVITPTRIKLFENCILLDKAKLNFLYVSAKIIDKIKLTEICFKKSSNDIEI